MGIDVRFYRSHRKSKPSGIAADLLSLADSLNISGFGVVGIGPLAGNALVKGLVEELPAQRCMGTWDKLAPPLHSHGCRKILHAYEHGGCEGLSSLVSGGIPSLDERARFYNLLARIPHV